MPKNDLKSSSAELVYGKSLTVQGSFVTTNTVPWTPQDPINIPGAVATSTRYTVNSNVPDNLFSSRYVFIRRYSHRCPTTILYWSI